jgi:hypothetical protein
VVVGADRDIRLIQIAAKNDVQQIRHGSFSRIRSTRLAATVGSIRDHGGDSVASDVGFVQTGRAGIQRARKDDNVGSTSITTGTGIR